MASEPRSLTKRQQRAIWRVEAALEAAHRAGVAFCGMDDTLYAYRADDFDRLADELPSSYEVQQALSEVSHTVRVAALLRVRRLVMPDVTPKTESGRAPGTYRTPEGGIEVIVGIEESASYVEDMWPDEVAYIEQEAASKAVAEVLDRLEKAVTDMPGAVVDLDGTMQSWRRSNDVLALIASERKP